ncbi:MAG: PAS domain S-box protein [Pseudomonadota bacterium]
MRRRLFAQLWITLALVACETLQAAETLKSELTLGVFAYRPKPIIEARYQPLVDYLNTQLTATRIELRVLELKEIEEALAHKQLDFIFTNPRHYILLRNRSKLTGAIATLIKRGSGGTETQNLGGVIFTSIGRNDIKQLTDIKGQRIAIPGTKYLGGYQTQAYELLQAGIELPQDVSLIEMGRHDAVVEAVLTGHADVGFVRTEVLEDLSHNGKLDMAQIKVINRQNLSAFPFASSTRLYPEWPFIALSHVNQRIVSRIASVLLALEAEHPIARAVGIAGFAPPADYLPVEEVARALRLPPYEQAPDFTLWDVWEKHNEGVILLLLLLVSVSYLMWLLAHRNQKLIRQQNVTREYAERIQQIIDATQAGTWEWNIQTGETIYNDRWAEMLGYTLHELSPISIETWMGLTHADDLQATQEILEQHFTGGSDYYEADFRMKHKAGHWVWIHDQGRVIEWAPDGSPLWMSGTHIDISARMQAEAERLEYQEQLIIFMETLPDAVFLKDGEGHWQLTNQLARELFQVNDYPWQDKTDAELGAERPDFHAAHEECIISDEAAWNSKDISIDYEEVITPDGELRTFEVRKMPLFQASGERKALVIIGRDITESAAAEEQLRKLSRAVEQSHSTIVITDLDANIEFVNPAFTHSTGYALEEVLGQNPRILQSGHQDKAFYQSMWDTLTAGEEWQGELHNKRKDGSLYWEFAAISPVKDETGKTTHYVAVKENITARREVEQALKESEQRFELAMSVANDGIWDWDLVNNTVVFDSRYYTMAGYQPNEFPSSFEEWQKRLHPDDVRMALFATEQHYAGESKSFDIEFRFLRKDGDYMWIRGRGKVVARDEKGYPLRFIGTHSDITERKQTELALQQSQSKYQRLVDDIGDKFVIYSHQALSGKLTYVSDGIASLFGLSKDEVLGKSWAEQVNWLPEDVLQAQSYITQQIEGKADFVQFDVRFIHPDGDERTIHVSSHPVRNEVDNQIIIDGIVEDITEQKTAQEQLRLAASVFAHSQEGIVITDASNRIVNVNPACLKLTGYSRKEVIGKNPNIFGSGAQPPEFYAEMWQILQTTGNWHGEIWNRRKSGEVYSERLSIDAVRDEAGKVQHYVAVFYDITYLKEHAAELERIAYNDALTGLPNRLLLRDRMQQALTQAKRNKKLVAICYLDLDGFKPINDTHGHKAGDQVLIEVAERLQSSMRTGDTVARLGGDEFVLLMPDLSSIDELEQALERILQAIAQPYKLSYMTVTISASIGIALYPLNEGEPDILLRHADQAMYVAKRQGKNRYSFFDASEEQKATATHAMQQEIEVALAKKQLRLFYQPKVNMRTGEVVGVEALIRWQHPHRGLLEPAVFLPSIEQTPLIVEIGNWVLHQALTQIQAWQAEGLEMKVSVNVDAQQLKNHHFVAALKSLLNEFNDVPAEQLELEILESTALHDIGHISRIMDECKKLGIQFALDDFGTGYSSLTYLKRLPAAVLKIDQSFVRDLLDDPDDLAITEGILGLAHAFNRTPVAEGVESVQHGTLLLNLGCDIAQGYGIARSMPAEQLPVWINNFQIPLEWKQAGGISQNDTDFSLLVMAVEHHRWVGRVLNALEQKAPSMLPINFDDAHHCKFGKWLDNEGDERYGKQSEFSHMVANHQYVHNLIKQTAELLTNGDSEPLQTTIVELKRLRNCVLDSLNKLKHKESQLK